MAKASAWRRSDLPPPRRAGEHAAGVEPAGKTNHLRSVPAQPPQRLRFRQVLLYLQRSGTSGRKGQKSVSYNDDSRCLAFAALAKPPLRPRSLSCSGVIFLAASLPPVLYLARMAAKTLRWERLRRAARRTSRAAYTCSLRGRGMEVCTINALLSRDSNTAKALLARGSRKFVRRTAQVSVISVTFCCDGTFFACAGKQSWGK